MKPSVRNVIRVIAVIGAAALIAFLVIRQTGIRQACRLAIFYPCRSADKGSRAGERGAAKAHSLLV